MPTLALTPVGRLFVGPLCGEEQGDTEGPSEFDDFLGQFTGFFTKILVSEQFLTFVDRRLPADAGRGLSSMLILG